MNERTSDHPGLRFAAVLQRVAEVAARAGRAPDDIRVVAVSKGHGRDAVTAAFAAGARAFGESYLQDWREKRSLADALPALEWHWVGQLQTKKVKEVAAHAFAIHSVDRPKLVDALAGAEFGGEVFLQVNVSGEEAKAGCAPEDAPALLELAQSKGLRVVGWMGMAPLHGEPEPAFERLATLRDALRARAPEAVRLSMGMSNDLEAAVAYGATDVRIGTAVFGPRPSVTP